MLPWGGDRWGRDVLDKAIKGSQVSIAVGVVAALCATLIGTLLGATAGFYGGWINDFLEWLYNVFTSIPGILLVFTLPAVLRSGPLASMFASGIWTVVIILACTGWTGGRSKTFELKTLTRAEWVGGVAPLRGEGLLCGFYLNELLLKLLAPSLR